ncbi:hypothetical protein HPB48_007770 [Haemaphysalis longicornis]|uniref:Uncharacterized protein n=1 Tax=Haemaphysalis longicornis TaxID=44386 RepID=A0A9J6FPL9_HAELO|nr:hypothetical protein HPB48_007770 [Haemaphysalis longicornis]
MVAILENLLQSDGSTSQQADRDEEVDTDEHVLPLLPEAPADPSSPAADQQPEHGAQPRPFELWTANQQHLLEKAQGSPVKLAGDGRADSPGFSAKYGTYSLLDVEKNKILHFEVMQVLIH